MRKFFQGRFRKLSLTQQVMVLILMMIVFLLLFFMFFLSESVQSAISSQMYDMLAARQEPIVQAVEVGKSTQNDAELFDYIAADANIRTAIVTEDQTYTISKIDNPRTQEFFDSLLPKARHLLEESKLANANGEDGEALHTPKDPPTYSSQNGGTLVFSPSRAEDIRQSVTTFHGSRYYYRLELVYGPTTQSVVVSFMNDTYAQELRSSLMDSTVYITLLVFFLLLMVLLFWVFSIIHPLNQIKSYITQIKEGKDVDLYINREDEIGDVAKELRALTSELAKQQKSKEEMIHNISHDLKTPIATIKSYSESIKDGIYPYGDLESSVDVILDNANRLEHKVHSLLYMNRVEYLVSSDAEGVSTNMKEVVEEVVLNAAVIRPEIELITDLEEVYFDGLLEAWRVCIENILQNAFRYAKSYIRIETRENEIRVCNDGPKMDEDRIQSLFLPYIKGEGGRFGLGLSIVAKVVQANNYKVEGLNTKDGVCFRIYRDAPKAKASRFKGSNNPVAYLNVQNWGSSIRSSSSASKRAAPDQKKGTPANNSSKKNDASKEESRKGRSSKNAGRKSKSSKSVKSAKSSKPAKADRSDDASRKKPAIPVPDVSSTKEEAGESQPVFEEKTKPAQLQQECLENDRPADKADGSVQTAEDANVPVQASEEQNISEANAEEKTGEERMEE